MTLYRLYDIIITSDKTDYIKEVLKMNMIDYYKLTISDSIDLKNEVVKNGKKVNKIFNNNTYRYNDLIEYRGDTFQIDSVIGIVDINNTACMI